ncbi:hypothetical protein Ahy_A02g005249 [Arachis hypogaea]|uniref:Uncharacterized protein n=1 Tax=Arachis hypogaea TaxID=3818 RepID=A0A445E6L2_ARAHY|nr:hypothetical protein Ahy_A02g005249 [Arachis hypogaea]
MASEPSRNIDLTLGEPKGPKEEPDTEDPSPSTSPPSAIRVMPVAVHIPSIPANSAYVDVNESAVSVSAGLTVTTNSVTNTLTNSTTSSATHITNSVTAAIIPQQTAIALPQNAVPAMWTAIPSNAFFVVPSVAAAGPSNAPQFFTFARPISAFVSSVMTPVQIQPAGSTAPSSKSPPRATVMAPSSATTTTHTLRDFSLEIYDKQELQFMSKSSSKH